MGAKGYKTSEFWVAIVTALLPILNKSFALGLPEESIYALLAYIIGRSGVKAAGALRNG
jgi:hypothetical protein